ncbi:MAG: PfkB family carbohydrate kinase [Phycisphaerae bacterium]
MSLLVTGSIGIDCVTTPHGTRKNIIGGSAVYFSWAAAHFTKVRLVAVVGEDCPKSFDKAFQHANIDITGLERRAGSKTFRWSGRYDSTMNEATTTAVDLNVLAEKTPRVPARFTDSKIVFLAATHPTLQMELLDQVRHPKLVVADTRDLWINQYRSELIASLKKVDGLVLNDLEARLLTGQVNLVAAIKKIRTMLKTSGPRMVVLKKGEHGCLTAYADALFAMPAYPTDKVIDPTGAGDSFAGGMLGYLAALPRWSLAHVKQAVAAGTVLASFTIQGFSLEGLKKADPAVVKMRMMEFKKMLTAGLV